MNILVTGGAGFIGSHVVDKYIAAGHAVSLVDSLVTGKPGNLHKHAAFYKIDITSPRLREVFETVRPDIVCHHAGQTRVDLSISDPLFDATNNILGSINLLELSRAFGVRKVIYASSVGAYGEPQRLPVDETHPLTPLSPYATTKHTVEHYLHLYHANYGLDYTVLRYANVYGPRQDPYGEAGVVAIFAARMLKGEVPTIYGTGQQTRDFVYAEDVATANVLALDRGSQAVCNIGTGVETSVNELYALLADATGFRAEAILGPARTGEIFRMFMDSRQAQDLLGWHPSIPLAEGLVRTVESFRN